MGSWATCQQAHLRCRPHSKTARTRNTSQTCSHPQWHHPRCPSRLGTGSQSHPLPQQELLLYHLLLPPPHHHHLPLQHPPSIQVVAAQTLAAASRTARGAPASNPSFGTFGRSNFSAGSLRILKPRLVVCSRRRPCCGGCTGSTSRARGQNGVAAVVLARGVTLVQLRLWWKHQHARTTLYISKRTNCTIFHFYYFSLFLHLIWHLFIAHQDCLLCITHDSQH